MSDLVKGYVLGCVVTTTLIVLVLNLVSAG